jgi:hypothetical protein
MSKEEQKNINKILYFMDDKYTIWVEIQPNNILSINVTDIDLSLTYNVADFSGAKYRVKNENAFNTIFVRAAKKRPQLIRDLMEFYNENNIETNILMRIKDNFGYMRRKTNVYTRKMVNRVKRKINY